MSKANIHSSHYAGNASKAKTRGLLSKLVRRALRNEDGVTAVEVGLVLFPFLSFIFAIIEVMFLMFMTNRLDNSVLSAVNVLRDEANPTEQLVRTAVCDGLLSLFDCNGVRIAVQPVSNISPELGPTGFQITSSDLMVIKAELDWPLLFAVSNTYLSLSGDGKRTISSAYFLWREARI